VGAHVIDTADERHWRLLFMHQDQVVALPDGATVVGRAAHCPIAMLRIGTSGLGIQAHPEFTADYELALIDARVKRLGADVAAEARASLAQPTDEGVVAGAITDFFEDSR
jgi:GMP synthase-like glutamine amidotransferase